MIRMRIRVIRKLGRGIKMCQFLTVFVIIIAMMRNCDVKKYKQNTWPIKEYNTDDLRMITMLLPEL